jgi:peptide/nickel transport system substrate-binding protein
MDASRRRFVASCLAAAGTGGGVWIPGLANADVQKAATVGPAPVRGGTAIIAILQEPTQLASALTSAGPTQQVSGKIFDGLLAYNIDSSPKPQLATAWKVSDDGLRITFHLRPNVRWHDGQPFTSEDVAFSVLEVWKKYHSRGRSTFANVTSVETPDALTAVLVLSKPAPYILNALASTESQPIPKHLYKSGDPLSNPHNLTPVGTGPFRFVSWERGNHMVLERNPDYWDAPRPNLDRLIVRFLSDPSAMANALETQAIHFGTPVYADLARLAKDPGLISYPLNTPFNATVNSLEFNLDRPVFRDVRVRQAFAHAIDRDFLLKNVWFGNGEVADSPLPKSMTTFHAKNLPAYEFDLRKAEALLEAAGLKRGENGVRLSLFLDPYPSQYLQQAAQLMRSNLSRIGIRLNIRSTDSGEFVQRVYSHRDFDVIIYGASAGPDPVIGVQRFYWSKNFAPGVAFSNGAHYANPEVDRLLLAAQTETDPSVRRSLYAQFQVIVQTDAVTLPLVVSSIPLVGSRRLREAITTADGLMGNFAGAYLAGAVG